MPIKDKRKEYVLVDNCTVKAVTGKALLLEHPEMEEEFWVPRSALHDDCSLDTRKQVGALIVEKWVSRERGFEALANDY